MDWFFTSEPLQQGQTVLITGEDAVHITKSLRMSVGEVITLCDRQQVGHPCQIEKISQDGVLVRVSHEQEVNHEPSVQVHLFFALTKGDKPETVIQKSVELGVTTITPILTERCISRPDRKGEENKLKRYRKIAEQAAMQSRRGIIPTVESMIGLKEVPTKAAALDKLILFYEGGGLPLREIITPADTKIGIVIGPEGGFSENEAAFLSQQGAVTATLGKRILRAETAPLAALAAIMFHTGNLE